MEEDFSIESYCKGQKEMFNDIRYLNSMSKEELVEFFSEKNIQGVLSHHTKDEITEAVQKSKYRHTINVGDIVRNFETNVKYLVVQIQHNCYICIQSQSLKVDSISTEVMKKYYWKEGKIYIPKDIIENLVIISKDI